MKKKLTILLLVSFLILPKSVLAIVKPTSNFYVNDYADILSSSTENYIVQNSKILDQKTKAQIVVVTVKNLEGKPLESYATELFRSFGIGDKTENNGLLILISLEERESRIEVGYGLEGILPDGKTGRFQDAYMIPYFRNDNFDEGILNGYKAFYKEIASYYGYDNLGDLPVESQNQDQSDEVIKFIMLFIIILFILRMMGSGIGGGRGRGIPIYGSFGGFNRGSSGGFSKGGGGFSGGGGSSRGF